MRARKLLLAFLFLLLLCGWSAVGSAGFPLAQGESPRAVVPETSHDFGTVKQGEKLVHTFLIRNEGTAPLTIARIDLSVPGTKTSFRKNVLPGETGQITMEWDTSNVQGEFEAGALVRLDDPNQSRIALRLSAVVKPPIEFVPFQQVFFSAYQDEAPEKKVRITNNEVRPLAITRVESSSNHYEAKLETVLTGYLYDLRVKVRPGSPFGRYADEPIYLYTDHPERPRLQVLGNLFVKPDFYVFPEGVNFGGFRSEALLKQPQLLALLKQTLVLSNRQGPLEIQQVETDLPFIEITREPASGKSDKFKLDITLVPEKLQKGKIAGNIRIVTNDPKVPEFLIPVRGEVR
ncbi:MAG: hypothetical protein A3F68_02825 [Acidobacteria bacterium RIFCSPLOWO2_12_FULL_54_10]|nr:MAG: hypothetical protein A3F68_02825 [Acidobacteria bacterium RIFCSPLOWO2_12_FULL_54_10]